MPSVYILATSMVEAQGCPGLVGNEQERRPVGQSPWISKRWEFPHGVQSPWVPSSGGVRQGQSYGF